MAAGEWHEVHGGWWQEPGPDGRYDGDTKPVVLCTADGDPLAMTNLDVDVFGEIDPAMIPPELDDIPDLHVAYWDD